MSPYFWMVDFYDGTKPISGCMYVMQVSYSICMHFECMHMPCIYELVIFDVTVYVLLLLDLCLLCEFVDNISLLIRHFSWLISN